jgi:glucokinase
MGSVLNCPLFVLGGGVGLHPALLGEVKRLLVEWQIHSSVQITQSALGADAQLFGALRLAFDTAQLQATAVAGQ